MIRLLFLLLFLAGVGFAAAWMADHPGHVVIRWLDWRIDTSFAFLTVLALAAAGLLLYLAALISRLISAPRRWREHMRLKHHQRGWAELTYGVAALAASDDTAALRHATKAEKLLGTTPLGLLITAQVARSRGDNDTARTLLTEMLNHRETKLMAARLLEPPRPRPQEPAWRGKMEKFWRRLKLRR